MTFAEMWAVAFPPLMWVLLVVSAVLCAVGFYKFVYFLSIGYGFAISGLGVTMLVLFCDSLSLPLILADAMFILYGIRLSGFLLVREWKNASYRKTLTEATKTEKPMPFFVKFVIWACVSVLYVMQVSPVYYAHSVGTMVEAVVYVGVAIMAIGLLLELVADLQKSAQKKKNPSSVAMKGLYKLCRCPNYFGEILFWTGCFVAGVTSMTGVVQWIIAILGYACIVYIMFNGAQRLEKRQMERYANDESYQAYVKKTPIILPLVPLYTLNRQKKS